MGEKGSKDFDGRRDEGVTKEEGRIKKVRRQKERKDGKGRARPKKKERERKTDEG